LLSIASIDIEFTAELGYLNGVAQHDIKVNGSPPLYLTRLSIFGVRLVLSVRYGPFHSGVCIPLSVVLRPMSSWQARVH
jgi:hypothetical protein